MNKILIVIKNCGPNSRSVIIKNKLYIIISYIFVGLVLINLLPYSNNISKIYVMLHEIIKMEQNIFLKLLVTIICSLKL